jgi:hypothetical protein
MFWVFRENEFNQKPTFEQKNYGSISFDDLNQVLLHENDLIESVPDPYGCRFWTKCIRGCST